MRCRFLVDGAPCPAGRLLESPFCAEHQGADLQEVLEERAVGDAEVAQTMRAELADRRMVDLEQQVNRKLAQMEGLLTRAIAAMTPAPDPPPAAAPAEDPDLAAQRAALAAQGIRAAKPGKRKSKPTAADVPTESEAHLSVVNRLREAQEAAFREREARARERRLRGLPPDEGRFPVEVQLQRSRKTDYSEVVDDKGINHRQPGFVYRHIRDYDLNPDGSRQDLKGRRLWEFKRNHGAEVVMRPIYDSTGKQTGEEPWVTPLGTLVRYPVEEYAQRVIDHSPYGAFDAALNRQTADLADFVEKENSKSGYREGVGQLVVPDEHGSQELRLQDFK